jgi:hypothetical protein
MDVRSQPARVLAVRNPANLLVVCRTAVSGMYDDWHAGELPQSLQCFNQARIYPSGGHSSGTPTLVLKNEDLDLPFQTNSLQVIIWNLDISPQNIGRKGQSSPGEVLPVTGPSDACHFWRTRASNERIYPNDS